MELYFQWLAQQVLSLASSGDLSRWPASAISIPQKASSVLALPYKGDVQR
jgi:hypothetical protein